MIKYIDYICDTTKEKIGKFSPGMHIPIKDMNTFTKISLIVLFICMESQKRNFEQRKKNLKGEWFSHVEL